ncbi:hypothetical protein Q3G72_021980 [Acer saccharum]|nr:hypothetical protein Q3G72_021980 [Acer saccharum]
MKDVTDPTRLVGAAFWRDLPNKAPSGLKVPKKVNPAIIKGFGDLELSFLDSTLGEKRVSTLGKNGDIGCGI